MTQTTFFMVIMVIRLLLASVLTAAGGAKLVDTRGFAATLAALGLPARRTAEIRVLSVGIPVVEIAVGLALVSGLWPLYTIIAALALMGLFCAVTAVTLLRSARVTCRCFGALSDSQISGWGLARSGALTVLAAVATWGEAVRQWQLSSPPLYVGLLAGGYLLFTAAAGQAASTIAFVQKRRET